MTFSHLGHSVLPIWIAIGPPRVSPWRTPPTRVDLVLLELHPGAAAVAEPAAGQGVGDVGRGHLDPGRQAFEDATREGPWDSPAVSQRNMVQVFHARLPAAGGARPLPETGEDRRTPDDADHGAEQHERAEGGSAGPR